jgi:hypothetical protein
VSSDLSLNINSELARSLGRALLVPLGLDADLILRVDYEADLREWERVVGHDIDRSMNRTIGLQVARRMVRRLARRSPHRATRSAARSLEASLSQAWACSDRLDRALLTVREAICSDPPLPTTRETSLLRSMALLLPCGRRDRWVEEEAANLAVAKGWERVRYLMQLMIGMPSFAWVVRHEEHRRVVCEMVAHTPMDVLIRHDLVPPVPPTDLPSDVLDAVHERVQALEDKFSHASHSQKFGDASQLFAQILIQEPRKRVARIEERQLDRTRVIGIVLAVLATLIMLAGSVLGILKVFGLP